MSRIKKDKPVFDLADLYEEALDRAEEKLYIEGEKEHDKEKK